MSVRWLSRRGYSLKSTGTVGWWVDGRCGFLVAGYYGERVDAIKAAVKRIKAATAAGTHPVWLVQ